MVYKLGQWLIDKRSGDVFEITKIYVDVYNPQYEMLKKIDGRTLTDYLSHYKMLTDYSSLQKNFQDGTSARLLYSR